MSGFIYIMHKVNEIYTPFIYVVSEILIIRQHCSHSITPEYTRVGHIIHTRHLIFQLISSESFFLSHKSFSTPGCFLKFDFANCSVKTMVVCSNSFYSALEILKKHLVQSYYIVLRTLLSSVLFKPIWAWMRNKVVKLATHSHSLFCGKLSREKNKKIIKASL